MKLRTPCSVISAIGLTLLAACAGGGARAERAAEGCDLRPGDVVFAQIGPVYRDCAVDRRVRTLSRGVMVDFRPDRVGCYSATVEFVVDTLGFPEVGTARVVRSTDPAFAQSAVAMLSRLKYEPARRGGMPVRQITTIEPKVSMVVASSGATPNMRPPC